MKRKSFSVPAALALALALACSLTATFTWLEASQRGGNPRGAAVVAIDPDDIGGVVTGPKGPEAGVWVIAESTNLPANLTRIVVTDDQGRYVLPDLPRAAYNVWVRGYGLVDSARVQAKPGQILNLSAIVAPDARAAAAIYPAEYWLSLLAVPPGKESTKDVLYGLKRCMMCHQIGNKATREIPLVASTGRSSLEAWDYRVRAGPVGVNMAGNYMQWGPQRAMLANWTDRIAAGDLPKTAPPRPSGRERNLVVTLWDWGTATTFSHTLAASDKRNPSVNAGGKVYITDQFQDLFLWLDPVENTSGQIPIPTRPGQSFTPLGYTAAKPAAPSIYWGDEEIWKGVAQPRSGIVDQEGRVWFASRFRAADNQPGFCKPGATNKFTQYYPLGNSNKQVAMFNPKTEKFALIDTCFSTDHDAFGDDPDNTLYFGGRDSINWVKTGTYDKTQDDEASQGWCPGVVDTNGDGKITKPWTEPNEPVDPTKDHRIAFGCYSVSTSPDGSVWCSGIGTVTKHVVRIDPGPNPPETCKAEVYNSPAGVEREGGVAVDSQGVAWQNWRGSDHVTGFDRRKCKVLNGPTATGDHCPEGWAVYRRPGPLFEGSDLRANLLYLLDVDRFDTLGLGKDVPLVQSVNSNALEALLPGTREWVNIQVPYPLGFYTRAAHGRIDDVTTGWKGRALWSAYMTYAPWHIEGGPGVMDGKGQKQKVVKLQFRPNPLAK